MKLIEKIRDGLVEEGKVVFSFEFFPPKTQDGVEKLFEGIEKMVAHGPAFCDITWGAGGSTADLTIDIANRMQNVPGVETMMHLTCTNMPVDKIDHALFTVESNGLRNVLALRGDHPYGLHNFVQIHGGFASALDLIPDEISAALEPVKDNDEGVRAFGIHLGAEMCKKVLVHGIRTLRLYTLNMEKSALAILMSKVSRSLSRADLFRAKEDFHSIFWAYRPWPESDGPQCEAKIITKQLGKTNTKGFLTLNSQPGENEKKCDSPFIGKQVA